MFYSFQTHGLCMCQAGLDGICCVAQAVFELAVILLPYPDSAATVGAYLA